MAVDSVSATCGTTQVGAKVPSRLNLTCIWLSGVGPISKDVKSKLVLGSLRMQIVHPSSSQERQV